LSCFRKDSRRAILEGEPGNGFQEGRSGTGCRG